MSKPSLVSGRQELILLITLAAVQFTHVLDFVIIMPLGPQFMRVFSITPTQFGLLVSSYTFSAGIFGFLGAFFIDRFDRKATLLGLYLGFMLGTFVCAVAPNFYTLLVGRIIAGAFGGILGATVYAIIGDLIPDERRGRATGIVMSAFSISSVIGVPIGLYIANLYGWHAPFFALVAVSSLVFVAAMRVLPRVRAHLDNGIKKNAISEMRLVLSDENHLRAFALIISIMIGGFSVIPYLSPYMVSNAGMTEVQLPLIYLVGGIFTFFSSQIIGRLADRFGKLKIYTIIASTSILPILVATHISLAPLLVNLIVTTAFMMFVSGRFVPAMALVTSSAEPNHRGGFMSVMSSIQQVAAGFASLLAGMIIDKAADGRLVNYDLVGYIAVLATLGSLLIARSVRARG